VELAALGDLSNKLGLTYNAIHKQAPQAKLVVLGYPHIFGSGSCTAGPAAGRRPGCHHAGTDALDTVIAEGVLVQAHHDLNELHPGAAPAVETPRPATPARDDRAINRRTLHRPPGPRRPR
jgi:hypothetical protein